VDPCRNASRVLSNFKELSMYQQPFKTWAAAFTMLLVAACASQGTTPGTEPGTTEPSPEFEESTILTEAENFFGEGAQGLADVLNKIFSEQGRPNAYIEGEEGGGAIGVGVRYGRGILHMSNGTARDVYWTGPSIGFDVGGNAAKAFVLIYDLPDVESLFQRFPGVDGSLYFIGGVGANYNRSGDIVLAPVRFGVGWRQGVSVGYLSISETATWIPF
jgi:hypothetical protein